MRFYTGWATSRRRSPAWQRQLIDLSRSLSMPHVPVQEYPDSSPIKETPVRKAFGGQVIGSTARLRRLTSGSGSPLKSIK